MRGYTLKVSYFTSSFLGLVLLVTAAFNTACNNSVVNESSSSASPTPATVAETAGQASTAVPSSNAAPATMPSATPVVLVTPLPLNGTSTAAETLRNAGIASSSNPAAPTDQRHVTDFPVELSTAKKSATPEPDAFPPRPTPTVEIVNGKIKQIWPAASEALALQNPLKPTIENITKGRDWYLQRCADCHGKSGKGNGWMGANLKRDGKALLPTNLVSQVVQANTDGELFWKITNGRSPMPASRVRFEDEQRWQIVLYLRSLR